MIRSWLQWALDARPFMKRWECGAWDDTLVATYVGASLIIWACYWAMAAHVLLRYPAVRGHLDRPRSALAAVLLLLLCGGTHLQDCLAFLWPAYRWATLALVATAAVTAWMAVALPGLLRHITSVPAPALLVRLLREKEEALEAARRALARSDIDRARLDTLRREEQNLALFYKTKLSVMEGRLAAHRDFADNIATLADVRELLAALPGPPPPEGP